MTELNKLLRDFRYKLVKTPELVVGFVEEYLEENASVFRLAMR